jgi:hypothetical protein
MHPFFRLCRVTILMFCLSAVTGFAERYQYPQITVTVYADGKQLSNALVFMQFFVPGSEACGSQWVKAGTTDKNGQFILVLADDKTRGIYTALLDKCACQENQFKGCFARERGTGETGIRIKISAAGYKTYSAEETFKGHFIQYTGHVYDQISIDALLDKAASN